uniref:Polyprotein n=1 Tax=Solanum tuberosum TaxID=4113 RepID=M1C6W3_SOLTU
MCDIIVNLPVSLDYKLKILKTTSLRYDLRINLTFTSALYVTLLKLHSKYFVLVLQLLNLKG